MKKAGGRRVGWRNEVYEKPSSILSRRPTLSAGNDTTYLPKEERARLSATRYTSLEVLLVLNQS